MSEIKAFVGHSFTGNDAEIVRRFLDLFDHVAALGIGFSWDHAENAEPKALTDKVLELIDGKNLFIGICTAKETIVVNPRQSRINRRQLVVNRDECFVKTSDWIIQEIGLAIGRNMKVMLLVEEGVRTPGGLQGNLEYIEFKRESPEKSFTKILEMIKAIKPSVATTVQIKEVDASKDNEVKKETEEEVKSDSNINPDPTWDEDKYDNALFHAIWEKDNAREDLISSLFQENINKDGDQEKNVEWEAKRYYWKIKYGSGSTLENLKQLFEANPDNKTVGRFLGLAYEAFESYDMSGEHSLRLASMTDVISEKVEHFCHAALQFSNAKKNEQVAMVLKELKGLAAINDKSEIELLKTLIEIYKDQGEHEFYIATLERYLDLNPDDSDKRFSVAYKYSELLKHNLSLYHYKKIPYRTRSSVVWNNVGVAYANLLLSARSIEAYRSAERSGNTLAMSNIAHKYIESGFLIEAEEICAAAVKVKDYDRKIGTAIAKIEEVKDYEVTKEKKSLDEAEPISKFFTEFGHSIIKDDVIISNTLWAGPLCTLDVETKGSKFIAKGCYEIPKGIGLLGIANPYMSTKSNDPPQMIQYTVKYNGSITGHAIKGTLQITKSETATTILDDSQNTKEVLMLVRSGMKEILVFEKETLKFHTLISKE